MNTQHIHLHSINKTNKFPYLKESISVIQKIIEKFPNNKITMGTGFGAPGVVLLDILTKIQYQVDLFYIDTGFLFDQTYDLEDI